MSDFTRFRRSSSLKNFWPNFFTSSLLRAHILSWDPLTSPWKSNIWRIIFSLWKLFFFNFELYSGGLFHSSGRARSAGDFSHFLKKKNLSPSWFLRRCQGVLTVWYKPVFSSVVAARRSFTEFLLLNQLSDWSQDSIINVVSAGRTRGPDLT